MSYKSDKSAIKRLNAYNMKQTAIQLLKESIDYEMKLGTKMVVNWDMYIEMEKEQMKEFYQDGFFIPFPSDATFEQIYKEKYETDGNTTSHYNG